MPCYSKTDILDVRGPAQLKSKRENFRIKAFFFFEYKNNTFMIFFLSDIKMH